MNQYEFPCQHIQHPLTVRLQMLSDDVSGCMRAQFGDARENCKTDGSHEVATRPDNGRLKLYARKCKRMRLSTCECAQMKTVSV
jgi:hypothetical protein